MKKIFAGIFFLLTYFIGFAQTQTDTYCPPCPSTITIGSGAANNGVWSVISGSGTFADATSKATTVTGVAFGTNEYQYIVAGVIKEDWTVNYYSVSAGSDIILCSYQTTAQLNGTDPSTVAGATGTWTCTSGNFTGTYANANLYNTAINGLVSGEVYTFRWTITNLPGGVCTNTIYDDVVVSVSAPIAVNAGADQTVCSGDNATLTANSGSAGLSYSWNTTPVQTTASITVTPVSSTNYTVTAQNAQGCIATDDVLVLVNQVNIYNLSTSATDYCTGSSGVTLTLSGSQSGINYTLFQNGAGINTTAGTGGALTWSNITAGTYEVKTDLCAKTMTGTITVTEHALPTVTVSADATICQGLSTALSASGGVTYAWSPASGLSNTSIPNPSASPASTTTYNVTATDNFGCSATKQVKVTVNSKPTASVAPSAITICNGDSATLNAAGGASYAWSSGESTQDITVSPSTTSVYTVTVTGANGCTDAASSTITVNTLPSVNFSGLSSAYCNNASSVTLTGNYAAGTFTGVNISDNGNGTASFVPSGFIGGGTYTITYSYQDPITLCTASKAQTVTINAVPQAYAVSGTAEYCSGGAGVPVGLSNSTAGIQYDLYLNSVYMTNTLGTGAATSFGNQTQPGTYTVKAVNTVTTCTSNMLGSAIVTVHPIPDDAQAISGSNQACAGSSSGYSVPAIANADQYVWQLPSNATITAGAGTNSVTVYFSPAAVSGNISVYGKNTCGNGASSTIAVTINPLPSAAGVISGTTSLCQGTTNVLYSVPSIADATSYLWTVPSGATITSGQGTSIISVDYGSSSLSGNITVKGVNSCGQGTAGFLAVTVYSAPQLTLDHSPSKVNCSGTPVTLSASSTTSPVTYTWQATNGGHFVSLADPLHPTVDAAGDYGVTVTDSHSCVSSDLVTVLSDQQPPQNISITSTNSGIITCTVTQVTLTASTTTAGSMGYLWSTTGGHIFSGANTSTPIVDKGGIYTVSVTNLNNGCTAQQSFTVTEQKNLPNISAVNPAADKLTCSQTSVILSGSSTTSNVTFNWTGPSGGPIPGVVSNGTTTNPTVNQPGFYTFTVTANNGCKSTTSVQVLTDYSAPTISVNSTPDSLTCSVSQVMLTGSSTTPGAILLWTRPALANISDPTIETPWVDKDGVYTLTVTHPLSGCKSSQNVTVVTNKTLPDVIVNKTPAPLTCSSLTTDLSGTSSVPSATLSWTGPAGATIANATTDHPTVNKAGDYTLIVTSPNGCINSDVVTVSESKASPAAPSITAEQLTCTKTQATLSASLIGNVTYLWTTTGSGTITNSTSAFATVNATGTYTVQVTDVNNGCTNQNSVTVTQNNTVPDVSITGGPYQISCTQDSITLTGSSTTGSSPVWTAAQGGNIISGGTSYTPKVNAAGSYTLTVTHPVSGCTKSATVGVTLGNDLPQININANPDVLTCATTKINLYGQPAESGTTWTWTTTDGNFVDPANVTDISNPEVDKAGTYVITVTKTSTSCKNTAAIVVQADQISPQIFISTPDKLTCSRSEVQINATSPNNVTYAWSTTASGEIKAGYENSQKPLVLKPAAYTVTITDVNNLCSSQTTVNVTEDKTLPNIQLDKNPLSVTCSRPQVSLSGFSLSSSTTLSWTTSNGGNIYNPTSQNPKVDAQGYYKLTVFSSLNGCSVSDSVNVPDDLTAPNVWVNTSPQPITCSNAQTKVSGNSSTSNVAFLWSGTGNISDATVKEPLVDAPGVYTFKVTSLTNGCSASLPVTVTQSTTPPAAPVASDASVCYGSAAGTLTATGNNVKWYSDASLASSSKLHDGSSFTPSGYTTAGSYLFFVTQTDPVTGCESAPAQVQYTINTLPSAPVNTDQAICEGSANPALSATGNNIKWYDLPGGTQIGSGSTYIPSVSAAGTYTYFATQTDGNGCESSSTGVSLTINALPSKPVIDKLSAEICYGSANPTFNASGSNIKWYSNSSLTIPAGNGGSFTPGNSATGTYPYYVTQTSVSGCVSPYETVIFTIKSLPALFNLTGGGTTCENTSGIPVGLDGSETNVDYQLYLNGTTLVSSVTGNGSAFNFGAQKTTGTYTIKGVGSNGCTLNMTGIKTITVNPLPAAIGSIIGFSKVCQGVTGLTYTITPVANAVTYQWTVPAGMTIVTGQGTNTINVNVASTASSGTISVAGVNSCGYGTAGNLNVTVVSTPDLTANPVGGTITCTTPILTLTSSSLTGGITYSWTATNGGHFTTGANTSQQNVTVDAAGDYIITVTEPQNSCKASASVNVLTDVNAPQNVTISATNSGILNCSITQLTLTASTTSTFPVGYDWTASSGGNILSGNNVANAVINKPGIYQVKVTNLNTGCYTVSSFTVTEQILLPNLTVTSPETEILTCSKTTATLDAQSSTSGTTFSWSGAGIVSGGNTATPSVNVAGTYTVTATGSNGCISTANVTVLSDKTQPGASVDTNPPVLNCSVTSVTLSGSSGTSGALFSWTGTGIVSGNTTANPVVNQPGTFTLTTTHPATGCTSTATVTVQQNIAAPAISFPVIPAKITCTVPSVSVQAVTTSVNPTYQWNTADGIISSGSASSTIVAAKDGTYTLLVTDLDNYCTASSSVVVQSDVTAPVALIDPPSTITCSQPVILLNGSSSTTPVNVNWTTSNGSIQTGSTSFNPSVSKAGTYVMTVTNTDNGCITQKSAIVSEDKVKPSISINKTPAQLNCKVTQVQLNGSASGATLAWTGPSGATIVNQNSVVPSVNKVGRYYLTATGSNGCVSIDSTDVSGDFTKPANVQIDAPGTLSCTNTSLTLAGHSTTSSAIFTWTTTGTGNILSSPNSETISIDGAGDYKMVVTHPVSFCKDSATTTVTQDLSAPSITFTTVPSPITCNLTTTTISSSVTPAGSSLQWTGPGTIVNGTTENSTVNSGGTYYLTATNTTTGCKTTKSISVTDSRFTPGVTIAQPLTVTCNRPNVTVTASTALTDYTAGWRTSNGAITGDTTQLSVVVTKAGIYTITLKDNPTGCTTSKNVSVSDSLTLPDIYTDPNPAALTCTNSQVTLYGSSSTASASLLWTGPGAITNATTQNPKVNTAGTFTLTVTGPNGCKSTSQVNVTENKTLPAVPSILVPDTMTCSTTSVNLEVSPVPSNVDFLWTTSGAGTITNPTSAIATVNAIGTYTLKVTDRTNGCSSQNSVAVVENKTKPVPAITGGPYQISCTSTSVVLDGSTSTGINPVWTPSNGGHIVSGSNTYMATIDAPGIYTLTTTGSKTGCTQSTDVTVTQDIGVPGITFYAFPNELNCLVSQDTLFGKPSAGGTSFSWAANPGHIVSGAATFNPIVDQAGTYVITVTDNATGCVNKASINVTQNKTAPVAAIAAPDDFTCTRNQVQLNSSSSGSNVAYNWSTSGTGSIRAGDENVQNPVVLSAGTYSLTVTDQNNHCSSVKTVTVNENKVVPAINVDKSPDSLTCSVKHVILSGQSLTTGATLLWTTHGTGSISNPVSQNPAVDAIGYYILTVTDPVNGCTNSDSVKVSENVTIPNIWVNTTPDTLSCTKSTVQLSGNSSTPNVSYLWSGPGTITSPTAKQPYVTEPGTYYLTVTSPGNGCTITLPVTVTKNITIPAAPLASNNSACYGSPAATLTATGNSIQWYSDPSLQSIYKVKTGNTYVPASYTTTGDHYFYVTQTDAQSHCEGPATQVTYSVKVLPAPPVTIGNSVCPGLPNPTLTASGTNINWYDSPGGTLLISASQYTPPASVNASGTYTYYATQTDGNGCQSNTQSATLTIYPQPSKPVVDKLAAEICQGEPSNPSFSASGSNIKWYASSTLPAPLQTGSVFTPPVSAAGIYSFYVTQTSANGCVSNYETVNFTIKPLPQKFIVTGGGDYCADQNGLSVGLDGSETTSAYQLLLNGTTVISTLSGTGTALGFGLQKNAGDYTIISTGTNGCTAQMTGGVSIASKPLPVGAGAVTGAVSVCQGATGISYSLPAISNATSYVWNVPTGATITSGLNSNTITVDFGTNAVTGNVNVYGMNSCGNGAVSSNLQVIVNQVPAAASAIKNIGGNNIVCLGDTGVIYEVDAITNATSYEWVLPAGATIMSGANTRQIRVKFATNAALGNQIIKVRGKNSCGSGAYSASYQVSVGSIPSIYAGPDQNICSYTTSLQGSTIPSGGSATWQLLSGSGSISDATINNPSIINLTQGDNIFEYTITSNGCKARDTVKVISNKLYVDAGENKIICSSDLTLQGTALPAGTSGIWSVASGSASFVSTSQPNANAYNFGYGDTRLYWTITKNGCANRDSVIITNYRPSTPDAGGDQSICTDHTFVSGNQPVYGTGTWELYSGSVSFTDYTSRNTEVTSVAKGKNIVLWTITNQICSLSDTVVIWNNANDVYAGHDQTLCDNRTTLEADPPATGATGQWSVLQGSASFLDPKIYNTKVSGLINGTNKIIWSVTKGSCTNSDTVSLISNMPTTAKAGADMEVPGNNTTLDGNIPVIGSGKWSVISGSAVFNNDTLYNTQVTNLNPGANILRWSITYKGCTSTDDVTVTNGTIETIDAGPDQVICDNKTQLEASQPLFGFGTWTIVKGSARFEDNEAFNTKVTDLLPGRNVLKWSVIVSGKEFFDTVAIVNNKPTEAITGPVQSLCVDSSVLSGNMAVDGTGIWTLEGGSASIANVFNPISKVTGLGNGPNTFRWTITKGSCVSSTLLVITNDKPTVAYAGLDQTLCDNTTTLMPNTPSIGTGEWSVISGSGSFSGNKVTNLAPGQNTLRWIIRNNNCTSGDDVIITSHKPTTANAGLNTVVCTDSIFLSANKPNTAIGEFARWSIMNGSGQFSDTTLNTSLIKRLAQGVNVLRWTINNNGCLSSDDVEINYAFVQSDAGPDVATCSNHVILSANNPTVGTGEWSVIGGSGSAVFVDPQSPNTEVQNIDQGKNILRWTITNLSCSSSSEVTITNNAPSDAFAGGDQSLCVNTTTMSARQPLIGKGSWSVLSGAGAFSDTSAFDAKVYNIGYGSNTYRWTIRNLNCVSADEVVISNNKPISTFAGVDQTLCADSAKLTANYPIVGYGTWSIVKGAGQIKDILSPLTTIQKLAADTNVVRWTVTNKQCVEYKEIKLVNNLPTIPLAGADRTICSAQTLMDGNAPVYGQGEWMVISGSGTFTNKNTYNTMVSGLTLGKNIFRWKMTKQNCILSDDVTLTNDLPSQPDAGTNISVCDNNTPLNGNKPLVGTGYWSVLSGHGIFVDSTQYNTMVLGLGQGSNYLTWTTVHNRCKLSDVVEVKNNQTDVYAGPDQLVFENSSMLVGNEPTRGIGTWSLSGGAGTIGSPNNFESSVTDLAVGINTFVWSVNIEGCISSDPVQVTFYRLPTASFSVNHTDGCPPLEVKFTKTTVENYPFNWDFGYKDSTSLEENPTFVYDKPGTYTAKLTVTGPDGNPVTKMKTITVHELPSVKFDLVPTKVYLPGDILHGYNYSSGGQTYLWDFGDGQTSDEMNPTHVYADSGAYTVKLKVWSQYQCTDSLIKENAVDVIETSEIKFPTAFTPNPNGGSGGTYNRNDYSNDVFYPIVIMGGIEDYHMEIFNRWGVLLFESHDINMGWDGYYKGKLMMEDVYIYRVTGRYNSGKKFSTTGDFLLMHK